jgi:hypothetical protein
LTWAIAISPAPTSSAAAIASNGESTGRGRIVERFTDASNENLLNFTHNNVVKQLFVSSEYSDREQFN